MKWKQKSCKQANKEMGKFDYTLWYGPSERDCYQVQGLIRNRRVERRSQANCQDRNGNFVSNEQLCFGSIKAARRFVVKHADWLIEDYRCRNAGRTPRVVIVMSWRKTRKHEMVITLPEHQSKDFVCRKTGRYVTKSCHVMAGRKESCKDLVAVDKPRDLTILGL